MVYVYTDKGFLCEETLYQPLEILKKIKDDCKNVVLDFAGNGQACLHFYYHYYYPILLKQFILNDGTYRWLNPAINKEINANFPPVIIDAVKERLANQWGNKTLADDIEKNGMYFPFIGNENDSVWFGKHRWLSLSLSNFNKDFLSIVINKETKNIINCPLLDFEDDVYYKIYFVKLAKFTTAVMRDLY